MVIIQSFYQQIMLKSPIPCIVIKKSARFSGTIIQLVPDLVDDTSASKASITHKLFPTGALDSSTKPWWPHEMVLMQ